jgi:hypothetical protein
MPQAAIHQNSLHSAPIADAGLSPVQAQVVAALVQGLTVTAAAVFTEPQFITGSGPSPGSTQPSKPRAMNTPPR